MIAKVIEISFPEGTDAMKSVSQVEHSLNHILEERANSLASETGCVKRHRKFSGAERLANAGLWLARPSRCQPGDVGVHGCDPPGASDRYGASQPLHQVLCPIFACRVRGDDQCR